MEGLETTPYLLFPCGAILWQECIQMSRGQKPYASISWIGQSTMFTPHSSVQRQTSLGEPRSVSCCLHLLWPMTMCVRVINTFRIWPARKWEGKLWQRNKLWLLCFFVASIVLLSSVISSWASIQSNAPSNQRQTRSECEWGDEKIAGSGRPPNFLDF